MNKITPKPLSETLPYAIARNTKAKHVAASVDPQLKVVYDNLDSILILPNLDRLPENILDSLAWQYHVDFYDFNAVLEKKRALIRHAIAWHRIKGTPAAIEELFKAVFRNAKVFEWFEYGGEPYHFEVRLIEEPIPSIEVLEGLLRAIAQTKNTRSWCDCLSFHRKINGDYHLGIAGCYKKTTQIRPAAFEASDAKEVIFYGGVVAVGRHSQIKPREMHMPDHNVESKIKFGIAVNQKSEIKPKLANMEGIEADHKIKIALSNLRKVEIING